MSLRQQLLSLSGAVLLLACASSTPMSVSEVVSRAEALDGQQVTVRGIIRVSNDFIGLKASLDPESDCLGMMIRESQFAQATAYDGQWGYVSGTLDADACDPEVAFCHDVCGPAAIVEPRFIVDRDP
jgi:hypothetical protein